MACDFLCGVEEAERVHEVFGVVAHAVVDGGGEAGFVAEGSPFVVLAPFAAVALPCVISEDEPCDGSGAGRDGGEAEGGTVWFCDAGELGVGDVEEGEGVGCVGDGGEAAVVLVEAAGGEPWEERDGAGVFEDVAEVGDRAALRRLGVDDFFIEAAGFADLGDGVACEGVAAAFGEDHGRGESVHERVAEDGAVRRGEEHLEEIGIIPCEEVCEAAEFEEDRVVAGVGDLVGAGETEEGIGGLDEDPFEVVV